MAKSAISFKLASLEFSSRGFYSNFTVETGSGPTYQQRLIAGNLKRKVSTILKNTERSDLYMKKTPLLTLGLPVYNGERDIQQTLRSIFDALNSVKDSSPIEILVSDNNSTDRTSEVVGEFSNAGYKVTYYCNETNVGFDGNIDAIVKRATGKYVWFLGCGETIKIDSLNRLLERLCGGDDYSNILLDFDIYDEIKDEIVTKRNFNFDDDILLEGKNNFEHDKYGPAVSSNIVNREMWLKVIDRKFVVDGWCHIERILNIISLNEGSKTLLLARPYFTLYRNKDGWWTKPGSYLLLLLHVKVIRSMLAMGYSDVVVKKLQYKQSRLALINAIIQSKYYGLKSSKKVFYDLFEIFKYDYFYWLFALPVLILPRKLMFLPKVIIRILGLLKRFFSLIFSKRKLVH